MPYIGKSPTGSGVRQRYHFTATGGETSLSGADDNSKTLKFTDGEYVDVYLNGILLVQGTDYGVGTANTISSLAALSGGDIVEVVVYDIFNVAKINSEAVRARHYFTATGGETSIGTAQISGLSFAANADIDVSLNGISLVAGTDYNTTAANTVGGLSALSAGNVIEIVIYEKFQLADTVSKASGGTFNGGVTFTSAATATGGLNVGTIKEATGTTTAMTIDSTGRILTPARPAFRAVLGTATAGQNYTTQQLIPVDTEKFDIGNNFDLSTKEFVAPIAGVYQFNALMAFGGAAGATSAALYLLKNDVIETDTGNQVSSDDPQGGGQVSISYSGCLQLAANDKVEFQFIVIGDTASNINSAEFSGFLVG